MSPSLTLRVVICLVILTTALNRQSALAGKLNRSKVYENVDFSQRRRFANDKLLHPARQTSAIEVGSGTAETEPLKTTFVVEETVSNPPVPAALVPPNP